MSDETCAHGTSLKNDCRTCEVMVDSRRAGGLVLRGWVCVCGIFNGEEKDTRTECRSCGLAKKEQP